MENKIKITLCFFFIVLLIFGIIIANYAKRGNELNNLKDMYTDIDLLEDSISMYYLDSGTLPIKNKNIDFKNTINPNDDLVYYEIDLQLLGNIKLTYGNREFGKNDIYIINNNSHTVYYYKGIEFENDIYYTRKDLNYEYIDLENYK